MPPISAVPPIHATDPCTSMPISAAYQFNLPLLLSASFQHCLSVLINAACPLSTALSGQFSLLPPPSSLAQDNRAHPLLLHVPFPFCVPQEVKCEVKEFTLPAVPTGEKEQIGCVILCEDGAGRTVGSELYETRSPLRALGLATLLGPSEAECQGDCCDPGSSATGDTYVDYFACGLTSTVSSEGGNRI